MEGDQNHTGIQEPLRRGYFMNAVRNIMENPELSGVRGEIQRLFTEERLTSKEIASRLNGSLCLPQGVSEASAAGIIRSVRVKLLSKETRKELTSTFHRDAIKTHAQKVSDARKEWMRGQEMLVWSDEQTAYFLQLLEDESFLRPATKETQELLKAENRERKRARPYNRNALAAAMNDRFGTDEFDADKCQRKLERIRLIQKEGRFAEPDIKLVTIQDLPEDPDIVEKLHWLHEKAQQKSWNINIHELNRVIEVLAVHMKEGDWPSLSEAIQEIIDPFSPQVRQLLYWILSQCQLRMGNKTEAFKSLEYGARIPGLCNQFFNEKILQLIAGEPAEEVKGKFIKPRHVLMFTKSPRFKA